MNRFNILLLISMLIIPSLLFSMEESRKIVILHSNDMHSRLEGFSPSLEYSPLVINNDNTVGGFSRIASIIAGERSNNPGRVLVVDAGDFLMGTIYHYMEEYNGFQLSLMKDMGYDVVAIGNHEFDYGPKKLATIIEKSVENGPVPELMLTNIEFDSDNTGDDELADLFSKEIIVRTSVIEKSGIRIGFFSLMGEDADEVAPFAVPATFGKQLKYAKAAVKELEAKGADLIICLSHSGLEKDKKGRWAGEDVELAAKVKGIDVIISGHTHTVLNEALNVSGTTIVQTGSEGRNIGRIELVEKNGEFVLDSYKLIPVNDKIKGSEEVQKRILTQKQNVIEKLLKPLGYGSLDPIAESGFELVCDEYGGDLENSNLGPLVADAIKTYIDNNSSAGTDISMVATGVIRDRIPPGLLSVQDIFRIMSLGSGKDNIPGYPLATVYLTGAELKRVVEILLVVSKSKPSNYCYYSGLEVKYNPDRGLLRKVVSISLVDNKGKKKFIDLNKKNKQLYSVSANAYMLEFIGIIKKTTLGLINVLPKSSDGSLITDMSTSIIDFDKSKEGVQEGKEWIALVEYIKNMDDTDGDGLADINDFYKKPPLRLVPLK